MKKLLLIMLCLITLTGCGNEVEQKPNEPSTKQEEKVEKKYLTVELEIEKECREAGEYWDAYCSNKVKSYKVENDKQGIFTNITLEDIIRAYFKEVEERYGSKHNGITKSDYLYSSIIRGFNRFASDYNLVALPDYSIYLDETKTSTSIVFKSKDGVKPYKDKINLNDNIVVHNEVDSIIQFNDRCAEAYYNDLGKTAFRDGYNGNPSTDKKLGMYTHNTCGMKVTQEALGKLNNTKWVKYLDKKSDKMYEGQPGYEYDVDYIIISQLKPLDSWLNMNIQFNEGLIDNVGTELVKEAHLFEGGRAPENSKYNQKEYFILDEKTCEEYNLICDRW